MFTAIIADKEYIEKINEYRSFLEPFLNQKEVAFCEWNREGERLAEMLPSLPETVGRRKEWRAIIICDENGLEKRNPFDVVTELPTRFEGPRHSETDDGTATIYEQYLLNEHEKKLRAFEEASHNSLTRLVTFFCESPTVTKPTSALSEDPAYGRYIAESAKKQELREAIRGGENMLVSLPTDILCVAKRTCPDLSVDFGTVWESHDEEEYSRFYDRNMYFDRMRYLVFDILPKEQKNYAFDYIRFLYATMLLAANEMPSGCLSANRVYRLNCENDEAALCKLLHLQEAKINMTEDLLKLRIKELQAEKPRRLSDREAETIFGAKATVPVLMEDDFDDEGLYVSGRRVGLANGCPIEEEALWESEYARSKKVFHRFLKQSRRALKRATSTVREEDNLSLRGVEYLNEFQIEDTEERIANEELAMIENVPPDLSNEEAYYKKLEVESKSVKNKINKRMYRPSTMIIGGLAIGVYALGFFTLFILNFKSNAFNLAASALIMLLAVAFIAVVSFATLFLLRWQLVRLFKRYNRTMGGINSSIMLAMARCSTYLSHVCNVRRGFSVLNAAQKKEDPNRSKVILYQKHILDMEEAKAATRDVFGHYMTGKNTVSADDVSAYDYNFDRYMEYDYPFPYTDGRVTTIDFLQPGVQIEVPVDFIKKLTVRREELYD